jgi:hypothetical protein
LARDFRERDGKGEQGQSSGGEEANALADVTWEPPPVEQRKEGRGKRLEADAGVCLAALGNVMGYVGC